MKYFEYILILVWHVLSKLIGYVWFFVAVPFRRYANNVVFNYVLQNGIYLKRLRERFLTSICINTYPLVISGWEIESKHCEEKGFIHYRKISWLEYQLVYWFIWGFLDADANDDTFDISRVEELHKESNLYEFLLRGCQRKQYGNAFDLGDCRADNFHFFATMFWNTRNTAQNFLYMQFQKKTQPFLHTVFGRKWGWDLCKDGKSYQLVYWGKR